MKLADFYAAIGPYLEGRASHEHTASLLYPEGSDGHDRERLAIYQRFCRIHRAEALQYTFQYCRAAVERAAGAEGWSALVEGYFRAHPMFHVELNENGGELCAFLATFAPAHCLPPWLVELADFEWWEWRTRTAPDAAEDARPNEGPLRLAATVELRPYRYDLVAYCDGAREGEPAPRPTVVLYWRDRDLDPRRERCTPIELAALKLVAEGLSIDELAAAGVDRHALAEAIEDLHVAGALLGAAPRR